MIKVDKYVQNNNVHSEYEALFSVIIPILRGLLYSLKRDIVDQVGGYEKITLELFTRLYEQGDGDCGICFEYAVHDAIVNNSPDVLERIDTALIKYCKIKQGNPTSILFGAEKTGGIQLIDSVNEHLTDNSYLLTGSVGQPIKLKKHIQGVVNAFRKPSERLKLPNSINGLWKADLFVGKTEPDKWVGTTVKINASQLEAARGLRLAIVPAKQGKSDKIQLNDSKNLIVCPMPYDQSFVEIFYQGWHIVKMFLNSHGDMPREDLLYNGLDRMVCKELVCRKKFPILSVIEAFEIFKQPYLIGTTETDAVIDSASEIKIDRIIAPSSFR